MRANYSRTTANCVTYKGSWRMLSFQLDTDIYNRINERAKELDMPTGALARRILMLGMETGEEKW